MNRSIVNKKVEGILDPNNTDEILINIQEDYGDQKTGTIGYLIQTNKQEIKITIDTGQQCCEDWGYLSSEDNFADYFGSKILSIEQVYEVYTKDGNIPPVLQGPGSGDEDSCIFININTTKGMLQFTLYNYHNGYYGHKCIITSEQLNIGEYL